MVLTVDAIEKPYLVNKYNSKKIKDGFLLTTEHGSWVYLSEREFQRLETNSLKEAEIGILKDKGIIIDNSSVEILQALYENQLSYLKSNQMMHTLFLKNGLSESTQNKIFEFITKLNNKKNKIYLHCVNNTVKAEAIKKSISLAKKKTSAQITLETNASILENELVDFLIIENVPLKIHLKNPDELKAPSFSEITTSLTPEISIHCSNKKWNAREIIDFCKKYHIEKIQLIPDLKFADNYFTIWKDFVEKSIDTNVKEETFIVILNLILKNIVLTSSLLGNPFGIIVNKLVYDSKGNAFYNENNAPPEEIFKVGSIDQEPSEILNSDEAKAIVRASLYENPIHQTSAYRPFYGTSLSYAFKKSGTVLEQFPNTRSKLVENMFDFLFEKILFDTKYQNYFLSLIK